MKAAKKAAPAPAPAASADLAHLLLALAALASDHECDRDGEGAVAVVEYLGKPAATTNGAARIEALASALAHTLGYGGALLCDVGTAIAGAEDKDESAASMAATVAPTLRQAARALLLGADEFERLAGELEGGAGES
jgi:hypothetical protein